MRSPLEYYLALWQAPKIGNKTLFQLVEKGINLEHLVTDTAFARCLPLPEATCEYLKHLSWAETEKLRAWQAQSSHHHILTLLDNDYPPLLKNSDEPPAVLFVKGDKQWLNQPQIAIVGCRAPSRYGEENAFQFAKALSEIGLTITSGLAKGIDTHAHQGTLAANGATIAVLGSGIEQIYPASNRMLAKQIAEHGAMVSELPLTTLPDKFHFPKRNRIISALSFGTLIIEAAENSGSLITARTALEQNREVFAIPGSIHSPMSRGCHRLIKEGATLVESLSDLILVLRDKLKMALVTSDVPTRQIAEAYLPIWQVLDTEKLAVDQIISRSQLDAKRVLDLLMMMEIEGLIEKCPGGYRRQFR